MKARNLVRLGLNVTVIHPTKFWKPDAGVSTEQINSGRVVDPAVRRPGYMTFSSKYIPVLGSTLRWTMITFERAVRRAIRGLDGSFVSRRKVLLPLGEALDFLV